MIPSGLLSEGYETTIRSVRESLEKRFTNRDFRLGVSPTFHRGIPNMQQLPNDSLGVWLDYTRVSPDREGQSWNTSCYLSEWNIVIVGRDEGNDGFGSQSTAAESLWAAITRTLTENQEDIHLDGTIEYTQDPDWRHVRGVAAGDQRWEAYEGSLIAKHARQLVRQPPP